MAIKVKSHKGKGIKNAGMYGIVPLALFGKRKILLLHIFIMPCK